MLDQADVDGLAVASLRDIDDWPQIILIMLRFPVTGAECPRIVVLVSAWKNLTYLWSALVVKSVSGWILFTFVVGARCWENKQSAERFCISNQSSQERELCFKVNNLVGQLESVNRGAWEAGRATPGPPCVTSINLHCWNSLFRGSCPSPCYCRDNLPSQELEGLRCSQQRSGSGTSLRNKKTSEKWELKVNLDNDILTSR